MNPTTCDPWSPFYVRERHLMLVFMMLKVRPIHGTGYKLTTSPQLLCSSEKETFSADDVQLQCSQSKKEARRRHRNARRNHPCWEQKTPGRNLNLSSHRFPQPSPATRRFWSPSLPPRTWTGPCFYDVKGAEWYTALEGSRLTSWARWEIQATSGLNKYTCAFGA